MIVALIVSFEAAAQQVLVDIDRAHGVIRHWHMYGDERLAFIVDTFYIIIKQNVTAHLVAVDSVPKRFEHLVGISHAFYLKPVFFVSVTMFLNA